MKLSDQALSCIMVALQKSLMEQTDIVPLLKSLDFLATGPELQELVVNNPPASINMNTTSNSTILDK